MRTSHNRENDPEFLDDILGRIFTARDEFFTYMKDFTDDLEDDAPEEDWDCLNFYFHEWAKERTSWSGGPGGQPDYKGPGTPEFEAFNQLLPLILIAVIDEALRYPEKLDASPVDEDGNPRPVYRRSIRYLLASKADVGRKTNLDDSYSDEFTVNFLEGVFPLIVSTQDNPS